jgi:hypothetical protein
LFDDARKSAKCIAQLLSPADMVAAGLTHEECGDVVFSMSRDLQAFYKQAQGSSSAESL